MKTVYIPVYGTFVVYIKYCAVCLKIEFTLIFFKKKKKKKKLIFLEYICTVSSSLIVKTLTNVLQLLEFLGLKADQ